MNSQVFVFRGEQVVDYIPQIAALRINIFHDYPYLYEGSTAYEENYLKMYTQDRDSIFALAMEGQKVIGAVTGLPAQSALKEISQAILSQNLDINTIYYLGEILILPDYRKKNLGKTLYQEFEAAVRKIGQYQKIIHCEVERAADHPQRPKNYSSPEEFWKKLGYRKFPEMQAAFSWKEIGDAEETWHPMIFSIKDLTD